MLLSLDLHGIWPACPFYRMAVRNGAVKDRRPGLECAQTPDESGRQIRISVVFRNVRVVDFLTSSMSGSFRRVLVTSRKFREVSIPLLGLYQSYIISFAVRPKNSVPFKPERLLHQLQQKKYSLVSIR